MSEGIARESADVVIVGGGVMGCAIALELATAGARSIVLERSVPGAEASSAAAGMLGAQLETHGGGASSSGSGELRSPFLALSIASRERFGALAASLRELTGIDIEWRSCGALRVALSEDESARAAEDARVQRELGLSVEVLDRVSVLDREPRLGPSVLGGVLFPDDARVDPPLYMRALRIAAERRGARFKSGSLVKRVVVDVETQTARGVEMEDGTLVAAGHVVIAAGSWSALVGGATITPSAVRPARGQIALLRVPSPILRGLVAGPRAYLSSRDDGRILVGSTLEFVGYEKLVTAGAVATLLTAAIEMVPELAGAELDRAWSSFRPYTADELPLIGETDTKGLLLATGHYRNGILLSPITAEIIRALVFGAPPPVETSAFAPRRLSQTA